MAGWMTALKLVPWGEVVKRAPQIADGARKLWQSVGPAQKRGRAAADDAPLATTATAPSTLDVLAGRVARLERELADATELIHSMAEQDQQLVAQIARLQRQARQQRIALAVLAVATLGLAAFVWSR